MRITDRYIPICAAFSVLAQLAFPQTFSFVDKQIETSSGDVVSLDIAVSEPPDDCQKLLITIQGSNREENFVFLDQAGGEVLLDGEGVVLFENTISAENNQNPNEYRAIIDLSQSSVKFDSKTPTPVLRVYVPVAMSGYGKQEFTFASGTVPLGYPKTAFITSVGNIIRPIRSSEYPQSSTVVLNRDLIPPFDDFTDQEIAKRWLPSGRGNFLSDIIAGLSGTVRTPGASMIWKYDTKTFGKWLSPDADSLVGLRWGTGQSAAQSDFRFGITSREDSKPDSILGAHHSGLMLDSYSNTNDYQTIWMEATDLRNELLPSAGLMLDPDIEYASPETLTLESLSWQVIPTRSVTNRKLEFNQAFEFNQTAGWAEASNSKATTIAGEKGLEIIFSEEAQGYALWRSSVENPAFKLKPGRIYNLEAQLFGEKISDGISRVRVLDNQNRFETHYFNQTSNQANYWTLSHWFQLPEGLDESEVLLEFDAIGEKGKIVLEWIKVSSYELPEGIEFPEPDASIDVEVAMDSDS